jgi:2-iminobutanoate/2-iminopropanoate deaminase
LLNQILKKTYRHYMKLEFQNLRKRIITSLPDGDSSPAEWATMGGNTLYTVSIPIRSDGSIDDGSIESQTKLTMENLKTIVESAGGTMDDVTQVQVFLTDKSYFDGMNNVYKTFFNEPYPNRATVIAGLLMGDAKIEIVAYAHIRGQM